MDAIFRTARREDLPEAARLVQSVVRECVGRWLAAEPIEEYCAFASPDGLASRFEGGHKFWIAMVNGCMAGTLEVKGSAHVLMLFVAPEFQRRGIGRALLTAAFPGFPGRFPLAITINSVPQSVPAYECMGFKVDGEEQNVRGLRFVPMKLNPAVQP